MIYKAQVELLLQSLPYVFRDPRIALKGGTALNLFEHDMPRLSVDIDLTYLPIEDRTVTFTEMHGILRGIADDLKRHLGFSVTSSQPLNGVKEAKLLVANREVEIKIEPNYTIRGAVFAPQRRDLSKKCLNTFGHAVTVPCLSRGDLYGGKICAALDRQHPRDLFDIKIFFETGGFNRDVVDCFLFYLLSHNRPFHEVLSPNRKLLEGEFSSEFSGMTEETVHIEVLEATRERLVKEILAQLTPMDRDFLISIASGAIDWGKFAHPQIQYYPSVRWRLSNLDNMEKRKRALQTNKLEALLS